MDSPSLRECFASITGQAYLKPSSSLAVNGDDSAMDWYPRIGVDGYPFDFDSSTRYTRPRGPFGATFGPFGYDVGSPSQCMGTFNLIGLFDTTAVFLSRAKTPSGPWIGGINAGGSTNPITTQNGLIQQQG